MRRDFLRAAATFIMGALKASFASEAAKHQAIDREFLATRSDVLTLAGLRDMLPSDLVRKHRNLRYHLKSDSVGRLALSSGVVVRQIGKLLDQDSHGNYPRVSPAIGRMMDAFFGNDNLGRDWPGYVFVMPGGYVTSRQHLSVKHAVSKNLKLEKSDVRTVTEGGCAFSLGGLWWQFDIPLDFNEIPLLVPDGRPSGWAKPVLRRRVRQVTHEDGNRSKELVTQIGRAAPDDVERFIKTDSYYPASHGSQILGPDGKSCFTKDTTVIVLARLVPRTSSVDAKIHQLSIALPTSMEGVRDLNYLIRSPREFVVNYAGLKELLDEGTLQRP